MHRLYHLPSQLINVSSIRSSNLSAEEMQTFFSTAALNWIPVNVKSQWDKRSCLCKGIWYMHKQQHTEFGLFWLLISSRGFWLVLLLCALIIKNRSLILGAVEPSRCSRVSTDVCSLMSKVSFGLIQPAIRRHCAEINKSHYRDKLLPVAPLLKATVTEAPWQV